MSDLLSITLTQGKFALVSPCDFDEVARYRWHAVRAKHTFYAARRTKEGTVYMHRSVMGVTGGRYITAVDHINHDGLDNRRENLRVVSCRENSRNNRRLVDGVPPWAIFQRSSDSWVARIRLNGNNHHLGVFDTEHDARTAYLAASVLIRKLEGTNA